MDIHDDNPAAPSGIKPQKLTEEELAELMRLDSPMVKALALWANKRLTCAYCRQCTLRCEVLKDAALDIGSVEDAYQRIVKLPFDRQPDAVVDLVQKHPEMYHALRRCCFCGHCTAECQQHMLGADRMRDWRELFMRTGYMPPEESKLVMVDNEWNIFSAYRAIWGIEYSECISLAQAAEHGPGLADTLFFPGCSLVSYAPELTKAVGAWLSEAGISWALSEDCCGSPLMSAGLFDRARELRQRILDQMQAAGITRMITVCPGCGEEFAQMFAGVIEIVPLPEILLKCGSRPDAQGPAFNPMDTASYTVFDSCHDRFDNRHGIAIRKLLMRYIPQAKRLEMQHNRSETLCCGAGGAAAGYDPDITERRVWRVIDEARATKAETLVTMCPTCAYTIAQACLAVEPERGIATRSYLELLMGVDIEWPTVFAQLNSMWTGEYGPWLNETFFS